MTTGTRHPSRETVVVAALALAAAAVRLPAARTQAFWEDEVASARIIRAHTFLDMLHGVVRTETSPPLWYALEWALHKTGLPIRDGRLLSVVLGGVLVVLVVALARRTLPFPLAAAAGALVAFGGEFVGHGHELRAYELLAVLSVAYGLALLRAVEHPTRRRLAALATVVAAGGLTHFFFAFTAAAGGAWLWGEPATQRVRLRVTAAVAFGCGVALAWTPAFRRQYRTDRFWWIGHFSVRYVVAVPLRLFTYAFSHPLVGPLLSSLALATIAVGATRLSRRREGRLVTALAAGPLAAAAALWAGGWQIFDLRNLIGTGGYFAVLLIAAAGALPRGLMVLAASMLVAAVGFALAVSHVGEVPRYDVMARTLVQDGWTGSQPIAVFGDPYLYKAPLEWYLPRQPLLVLARAGAASCPFVYVVGSDGRVRRERLQGPLESTRALRGALFLLAAGHHAPCVRTFRPAHPPTVA